MENSQTEQEIILLVHWQFCSGVLIQVRKASDIISGRSSQSWYIIDTLISQDRSESDFARDPFQAEWYWFSQRLIPVQEDTPWAVLLTTAYGFTPAFLLS
jgi:hypothetical protein